METTPDKYCQWKVSTDYLTDAMEQLHENGSTVVTVVPYEFEPSVVASPISKSFKVRFYMLIHYNPPVRVQGMMPPGDEPDSATIQ